MPITEEDKGIVKEVSMIGLGHASSALYQLLDREVTIQLPELDIISKESFSQLFKGEDILVGLHFRVLGDLNGVLLYLFRKEDAIALVNTITKIPKKPMTMLTDADVGIIKEVANILSGAYLNALAQFSGIRLLPSLPHFVLDSASSIFDFVTAPFSENYQFLLVKNDVVIEEGSGIRGTLIFVIGNEELAGMLSKIKIKYKQD